MPRIAIPTEDGRLLSHFGRVREFSVFDIDDAQRRIIESSIVQMPGHTQCREVSQELKRQRVDLVIAGGIGGGAASALTGAGIELLAGAPAEPVEQLAQAWLEGRLAPGPVGCQEHDGRGHGHGHGGGCRHS